MARTLQKDENLVQSEPKYKVGDELTYINDYCVNWGLRTITDMVQDQWGWSYYISSTDTPWCPVREKNLYVPGTEPTFDLELNNGMTAKLVETDWNGNRYYNIGGRIAVLTDGFLYTTAGDFAEACCRLEDQFQPKSEGRELSLGQNEKAKQAVVNLLCQYSKDEILNGNWWGGSSEPIEGVSEHGIDVNVYISDEDNPESSYSIIAYPLMPTEDNNYTADVSEVLFTHTISKSEFSLLVTPPESETVEKTTGNDYFSTRTTDKKSAPSRGMPLKR